MAPHGRYFVTVGAAGGTGGQKFGFTAPSQIYDSLKDELGLGETTAENAAEGGVLNVGMSKVPCARIAIRYQHSATIVRTAKLICDIDKVSSAIKALPSKQFRGKQILNAYLPRKRTLI